MLIHAQQAAHGEHRFLEEAHEEESHEGEGGFAWKFGASLLGGFLLPTLMHTILPQAQDILEECEECQQELPLGAITLSPAARVLVEEEDGGTEGNEVGDNKEDMRTMESGCDAQECDHPHHRAGAEAATVPVVANKGTMEHSTHNQVNLPLTLSILLGDAIHNMTDGVFLANAFLLCSKDLGE